MTHLGKPQIESDLSLQIAKSPQAHMVFFRRRVIYPSSAAAIKRMLIKLPAISHFDTNAKRCNVNCDQSPAGPSNRLDMGVIDNIVFTSNLFLKKCLKGQSNILKHLKIANLEITHGPKLMKFVARAQSLRSADFSHISFIKCQKLSMNYQQFLQRFTRKNILSISLSKNHFSDTKCEKLLSRLSKNIVFINFSNIFAKYQVGKYCIIMQGIFQGRNFDREPVAKIIEIFKAGNTLKYAEMSYKKYNAEISGLMPTLKNCSEFRLIEASLPPSKVLQESLIFPIVEISSLQKLDIVIDFNPTTDFLLALAKLKLIRLGLNLRYFSPSLSDEKNWLECFEKLGSLRSLGLNMNKLGLDEHMYTYFGKLISQVSNLQLICLESFNTIAGIGNLLRGLKLPKLENIQLGFLIGGTHSTDEMDLKDFFLNHKEIRYLKLDARIQNDNVNKDNIKEIFEGIGFLSGLKYLDLMVGRVRNLQIMDHIFGMIQNLRELVSLTFSIDEFSPKNDEEMILLMKTLVSLKKLLTLKLKIGSDTMTGLGFELLEQMIPKLSRLKQCTIGFAHSFHGKTEFPRVAFGHFVATYINEVEKHMF
jgi:hypothetical protein